MFRIGPANFRLHEFIRYLMDEVNLIYMFGNAGRNWDSRSGRTLLIVLPVGGGYFRRTVGQQRRTALGCGIAYAVLLAHLATFDGARYPYGSS
jgi:hypothetical protein